MENIIEMLRTDSFLIIMAVINILLLVGFVIVLIKLTKLSGKYKKFMQKLGDGKSIEEDLENYMYRVERVEKQNAEMAGYVKSIDEDLEKCVQKIGIVRYNAFKDTGSDLSFALALLDENNNGVVLNGIYSREMSNIYAKPVEAGKSSYTVSEEEEEAIKRAINFGGVQRIK